MLSEEHPISNKDGPALFHDPPRHGAQRGAEPQYLIKNA